MRQFRHAQGFTLIELMISLVLGLLITAAVMQVYIMNVKTAATQKSGSELQDSSVFGLQQLESRLRLVNLGNPANIIDATTAGGGVVMSLTNIRLPDTATDKVPLLTHSAGDANYTGQSNMTSADSDQLTIQFTNITNDKLLDCESADIDIGDTVIERYFIDALSDTNPELVLRCDAGRLDATGIKTYDANDSKSFGGAGRAFILGVDQFKVLLGTQSTKGEMQYLTPKQYMTLAKPAADSGKTAIVLPITAVKVGVIARGNTPIIGNDPPTKFRLFGQEYTVKKEDKKLRKTYETTVLLRNARVVKVDISKDLKGS